MQLSNLYVIVIEPSNVQRHIILAQLQQIGVTQIEEFSSAEPALERMLSITPDLVLSAMHLPGISGTELVNQMRVLPALEMVTFILISSETHYRYLEPIRQAGAIAILPKPFTADDLATAMRSTLEYISDVETETDNEEYDHLRVLLVDDSAMACRYVQQMLDGLGIGTISTANDGAEALSLLQSGNGFDLIITDYNMPNIDGKELTEHIRQHGDQPTIPILMLTSEQNQSRLAAIQSAGVSAICNKPFSYGTVKLLIEQLINERDI
ncbi:response regulator [Pontibacter sp. JAM-7]|uniref:response regulator n=1 Tax=Pontibacter sp. JAM-7 TaxID=3366581 RepID=UPI003AF9D09D